MQDKRPPRSTHSLRERLGVGLVLAALAVGVSASGWLARLDHFVFDLSQRLGGQPAPAGVVIAAIDQASLQELSLIHI